MNPPDLPEALFSTTRPVLVGVRHHAPSLAAAMPTLLDAVAPKRVFLELPPELSAWLPWLGHPELQAPVALAATSPGGHHTFLPFADFSPELAAVRWAVAKGVPVIAIDAPLSQRLGGRSESAQRVVPALFDRFGVDDVGALWDRMVEARAPGASPEALRRAGLAFGWALRSDDTRRSVRDEAREAHMRSVMAEHGTADAVAVVGAYHAAALLPEPLLWSAPEQSPTPHSSEPPVTALVPYRHDLLDARSGYPAGIRDPALRQALYTALASGADDAADHAIADAIVAVCRGVRALGHVAGVPDAAEALRLARDLARLRGLPAPGRSELLEALQSAVSRGEGVGRSRVLARAMAPVLVGSRHGRLAPGTPVSGLTPHVGKLLADLGLPGPGTDRTDIRLDVLRSTRDRRRAVALARLQVAGVHYGQRIDNTAAGGIETLTQRWRLHHAPATHASLAVAGTRGVTLQQAAEGTLLHRRQHLQSTDGWTAAAQLAWTTAAAEAGLGVQAAAGLSDLAAAFLDEAGLAEVVGAFGLVSRIRAGHVPALPTTEAAAIAGEVDVFHMPADVHPSLFLASAVAAIDGLAGSRSLDDVHALMEVADALEHQPADGPVVGRARLVHAVADLAVHGSALMQGAAAALCVQLGHHHPGRYARALSGWLDAPADLSDRLQGALTASGPALTGSAEVLTPLAQRIEGLPDPDFLRRLPALRRGFHVLSPPARQAFLSGVAERLGTGTRMLHATLHHAPETLALWASADRAGAEAAARLGWTTSPAPTPDAPSAPEPADVHPHQLSPIDRWRLILGRERQRLSAGARRVGRTLDELYGDADGIDGQDGGGGGQEPGFPSIREWAGELEALFGDRVREEVLGHALEAGRVAAAFELDAEAVRPSVDLLRQVLGLRGSLSEGQLIKLRPLVARMVAALTRALAIRVRPALSGLALPRPTRRPGGPLDLPRTIRANLHTLRPGPEGPRVVPERLIFRSRGRRTMDWHVILVVDVSGSMEASTVYAALMAAILAGAPWVSVSFLAFDTQVIDLSEHASDPLKLLLEVQVGGGTHIAKAIRHARSLVRVPRRTVVVVVSDFEEGFAAGSLVAEVRALVQSGAQCLGLAALDDAGAPRYHRPIARQVAAAGMPVAALSPLELARWVAEKIHG